MFVKRQRSTLAKPVAATLSMALGAALGVTVAQSASAQELPPGHAVCVSAVHPKLAARLSRGITGALRGRRSLVGLTVADARAELACKVDQSAHDELTLLRLLTSAGQVLATASRRYVLWLMAHVIPDQRWGVPAGAPAGATVHVKNGWLPYPTGSDWHINSIGAFTGHLINYQIVVLTSRNPSMAYGIDTIQAAARVINRDLAGE